MRYAPIGNHASIWPRQQVAGPASASGGLGSGCAAFQSVRHPLRRQPRRHEHGRRPHRQRKGPGGVSLADQQPQHRQGRRHRPGQEHRQPPPQPSRALSDSARALKRKARSSRPDSSVESCSFIHSRTHWQHYRLERTGPAAMRWVRLSEGLGADANAFSDLVP